MLLPGLLVPPRSTWAKQWFDAIYSQVTSDYTPSFKSMCIVIGTTVKKENSGLNHNGKNKVKKTDLQLDKFKMISNKIITNREGHTHRHACAHISVLPPVLAQSSQINNVRINVTPLIKCSGGRWELEHLLTPHISAACRLQGGRA